MGRMHLARETGPAMIAMLTPSSNTVLEPCTSVLAMPLYPRVTLHFARFRVTRIALDEASDHQFALGNVLAAAELLADARPDIIAWNGTSASWLGFDYDTRLCAAVEERTNIPATSAVLSLNRLLRLRAITRIGLVSPYTEAVQKRIVANYAGIGIDVAAERHAGLSDNFSFAALDERRIGAMCEEVAGAAPQAIVIMCTNMRGALIAADIEQRLGIPVLDSVAFTMWGCLTQLGIPTAPLAKFGSLFRA
jgi:maleate isomerase